MKIRKASSEALGVILDIYNYEVINGTATFDLRPKSQEEWNRWFDAHQDRHRPLIVAEREGHVAGYASLSSYREKEAYRCTAELSVYVAPDDRRCGVATALMEEILKLAKKDETLHTVVSVITSGNEVSRRLHERFGFTFCGTIRDVGIKFGQYLSIDQYRLSVGKNIIV